MVQFNLLPDVKIEYIKAQRTRRMVMSVSILASAVALGIFLILLLTVAVWQRKTISDLSGDIKAESSKLQNTPSLNKILTIQSQLGSLDQLHSQKPAAERAFGFLSQVTPSEASISDYNVDFTAGTMTISGSAGNLDTINTFTDGLKFTKYSVGDSDEKKNAFSEVVLTTFSRTANAATYTIDLKFDPVIFSNTEQVTLSVPNMVTTRSIIEKPLFTGGN